jgi:DNA-binding NarL/FixJ family response regulator
MAAARLDPTARQILVFATYCRAGSRIEAARHLGVSETTVAAQMNELFSRLGVAGPFTAARALGWLVIPDLSDNQRAEAGHRWLTTEAGRPI